MKNIINFVILGLLCIPFMVNADEDLSLKKNIIVVFDDSGSMGSILVKGKIDQARDAVSSLIRSLPSDYNFGVYALNKGYIIKLDSINKNRDEALRAISIVKAGGSTPITKAIRISQKHLKNQMKKQGDYGFYTIVIVTDGAADDKNNMFRAVDVAISNSINIKTIGFGLKGKKHDLKKVTNYVDASSTAELTAALKKAVKAEIPGNTKFVVQDF